MTSECLCFFSNQSIPSFILSSFSIILSSIFHSLQEWIISKSLLFCRGLPLFSLLFFLPIIIIHSLAISSSIQSSSSPLEISSPQGDLLSINYRSTSSIHRSDSKRSSRILLEQEIYPSDIQLKGKEDKYLPKSLPFMPQTENPLEDELFHKLFRCDQFIIFHYEWYSIPFSLEIASRFSPQIIQFPFRKREGRII